MSVNNINSPYAGLMAAQYRQNVTANNVANVNTPGFQPQTPQSVQPAQTPPPAAQAAGSAAYINEIGQGGAARPTAAAYAPQRPAAPTEMPQAAETTAAPPMSNVDMITETANRLNAQTAYSANIPAARTMNEMSQTLMDIQG